LKSAAGQNRLRFNSRGCIGCPFRELLSDAHRIPGLLKQKKGGKLHRAADKQVNSEN